MKKLFLLFFIAFASLSAKAQIDLSVNPVSLLYSNFDFAAEYRVSPDFGLELSPGLSFNKYGLSGNDWESTGFGARLIGKYYFSPDKGCDKFNIGPYIKYGSSSLKYNDGSTEHTASNTRFAIGFYTGYKWVSRRNIVFEIGLGVGKALSNTYKSDDETVDTNGFDVFNIDATFKFAVGYRFGG
ncbi:MAG TPA: DUF3575 domain-containing protein [Saprospiraceae bacterium]|nr:DUF3575 domain-containing protein [Saprospiraceae bacterium]